MGTQPNGGTDWSMSNIPNCLGLVEETSTGQRRTRILSPVERYLQNTGNPAYSVNFTPGTRTTVPAFSISSPVVNPQSVVVPGAQPAPAPTTTTVTPVTNTNQFS